MQTLALPGRDVCLLEQQLNVFGRGRPPSICPILMWALLETQLVVWSSGLGAKIVGVAAAHPAVANTAAAAFTPEVSPAVTNLLRQFGDGKVSCPHESGSARFVKRVGGLNP